MTKAMQNMILMARTYLLDREITNRLIGENLEYADDEIINATEIALMKINSMYVPKTAYTVDTIPDDHLLLLGVVTTLLLSKIQSKTRNYMTVNDGGVMTNREGNIEQYKEMYRTVSAEYERLLMNFKIELNIRQGFGV
jgi:hypothetical protein